MKKMIIILALIILFSFSSFRIIAQDGNEKGYPLLSLVKKVDKEEISPGDTISVIIRITNIGNATAYNITLVDQKVPEWVGETIGNVTAHWEELKPNNTIIYEYKIKIKDVVLTNITLGEAKLIYYDVNGTKYVVYSSKTVIKVNLPTGTILDWDSIWRTVIIIEGLIVICVIALMLALEYLSYREYLKTVKKKK